MTGDDDYLVRDLTNPSERADFVRKVSALAALGVDGFKGDRGDEVDLEKNTLVGGPGVLLQNSFPLLYAKAVADAMRGTSQALGESLPSAAPGSAAVLPGFVGEDRQQTWNGLYDSIERPKQQASPGRRCGGRTSGATRAVAT